MTNTASDIFHNPNYMTQLTAGDQLFCTPDGHLISHQDDRIHTFVWNNNSKHKYYPGKYEVSRAWGNFMMVPNQDDFLDHPDVEVQRPGSW